LRIRVALKGVGSSEHVSQGVTIFDVDRTVPGVKMEVSDTQVDLSRAVGETVYQIEGELFLVTEVNRRDRARTIENNNYIERCSAIAISGRNQGRGSSGGGTRRIGEGPSGGQGKGKWEATSEGDRGNTGGSLSAASSAKNGHSSRQRAHGT
jgi:hypothetical protein